MVIPGFGQQLYGVNEGITVRRIGHIVTFGVDIFKAKDVFPLRSFRCQGSQRADLAVRPFNHLTIFIVVVYDHFNKFKCYRVLRMFVGHCGILERNIKGNLVYLRIIHRIS